MNKPSKNNALLPVLILFTLLCLTFTTTLFMCGHHTKEMARANNKLAELQRYADELETGLIECRQKTLDEFLLTNSSNVLMVTASNTPGKTTFYLMHRKVTLP